MVLCWLTFSSVLLYGRYRCLGPLCDYLRPHRVRSYELQLGLIRAWRPLQQYHQIEYIHRQFRVDYRL